MAPFDRSPVGGFSYTVLAAAHEVERRMTGEKIRAAYKHAARQGQMVGQVPGGYRRESDGSITIDEAAAATVRRIFSEYASGRHTARDIALRLNAEGVPPLPRSRGAGWRFYSVAEVLRNVAYAGQTFSESRRRHGKGELMAARWPAIIEPELWEAAQRRANRAFTGHGGRRPKGQERPYVFRGLLRCSCGARLSAAFRYGHLAYQCPRDHDVRPCRESRVYERDLLPWGRELFSQLEQLTPADFAATVEQMAKRGRRHTSPGALQSIESSLERHRKLFTWGHITEADYLREERRLEELREELRGQEQKPTTFKLRGLLDAWDLGDGITRARCWRLSSTSCTSREGRSSATRPGRIEKVRS